MFGIKEVKYAPNATIYLVFNTEACKFYVIGEQIANILEYSQTRNLYKWAGHENRIDIRKNVFQEDFLVCSNYDLPRVNEDDFKRKIINKLYKDNTTIKLLDYNWFLNRSVQHELASTIKDAINNEIAILEPKLLKAKAKKEINEAGTVKVEDLIEIFSKFDKSVNRSETPIFNMDNYVLAATSVDRLLRLDIAEKVKLATLNDMQRQFVDINLHEIYQNAIA